MFQPDVLEDKDAKYTLIIRLILMEPGTIQTHPEMGVGIISRWRYSDSEDLLNLQNEIRKQISKYLPLELQTSSVSVSYSGKQLILNITVDGETKSVSISDNGTYSLSDVY
jgi:septum formation topological specificity factor MinE